MVHQIKLKMETTKQQSRQQIQLATEESYDLSESVSASRLPTETKQRPSIDQEKQEGLVHTKTTSFTQVSKGQVIESANRPSTQKSKSQSKYQIPRKSEQFDLETQATIQKQMNVPKFIGKYKLQEIVGRGAHGRVYKAIDTETDSCVAIKLFGVNRFQVDVKQSITYEIDLLKRLDHCNIVKYIDTVQSGQFLCIILEYIDGGSLESLVTRIGCFSETLAAVYIKQVLIGLDYLHSQGVIHRDIKGGNILVTLNGVVKLADFGVATKLTDAVKNISFAGTPYWMAPEVIEMSGHITSACDIWSVGCTVFELLTGKPPRYNMDQFPAMIKIVNEQMPLPEDITPELRDFLQKCFIKDPSHRPDARSLLQHPWFTKQADQNKLAQILALNPPLEVTNTIKIHLNGKGQPSLQEGKKVKKIIQDGKLVQVKRSASSTKNPIPLGNGPKGQTSRIERFDKRPSDAREFEGLQGESDPKIIVVRQGFTQLPGQRNDKQPNGLRVVTKNQSVTEEQIKKIPSSQRVSKPLNSSNEAPTKVIPYAKIQQACKNAALKFKKINLVSGGEKVPVQKKSRNNQPDLSASGKTSEAQPSVVIHTSSAQQALLHQSKSFQDVHHGQFTNEDQSVEYGQNWPEQQRLSEKMNIKPGQLYDLRNPRRMQPVHSDFEGTDSQLVTEHSASKSIEPAYPDRNTNSDERRMLQGGQTDSETQSKKQSNRSKARMIGRGFSMLATSCISSTQQPEDDLMIANPDNQHTDVLSRLGHDQTHVKQKENTRQNSGMTKQLANLLNQHQSFEQQVHNHKYVSNSHQSNKSYPSNGQHNVPLSKGPINGHGHSSTFEKPVNSSSILAGGASNFPQTQNFSSDLGRTSNEETCSQIETKQPMQRIGSSKRSMQKNSSANVLSLQQHRDSVQEASRQGGHKNTASFLTKFAAEELNNRAQYQMFNKPPSQTLETPTASQSFDLISNPQSRRNAREAHQQRLQLAGSPNQSSVPDLRQRTVSYGAKFAAAGPASSQQIGFQNGLNRSIVAGKSVDFFRVPASDSLQNSQSMEDQVAALVGRPPRMQEQILSGSQEHALASKTFDNRKHSRDVISQPGGSERVQHRAPNQTSQKDIALSLIDQACLYSNKLVKAVSHISRVADEQKEIVKTIKQLNQLIEISTNSGQAAFEAKADLTLIKKLKQTIWQQAGAVTLIKLLKHSSEGVAYAALQLLNQLSEREADRQQLLVSAGLIPILIRLCLLVECAEVSERELRVEIAYFIGQIFQDSKQLIDQYIACEGYRIQMVFLTLPYEPNTDLVMIAIDSFLVIFEECLHVQQSPDQRKRSRSRESKDKENCQPRRLDQHGIASILIAEGLVSKLVGLVPEVIKHADLSTSHKDQSNAETIIERIFDMLINLASFSGYHDKKHFSKDQVRTHLCDVIVQQTKDPQQLTFLTTRQLLKLLQTLTSLPKEDCDRHSQGRSSSQNKKDLDPRQQAKIIRKLSQCGFMKVQVEILHFYLGLIEHIQLSSIYDSLKLLNTFCKASPDYCALAMDGNGLVISLKRLLLYIDQKQDAISLGKRIRLLNLILSIVTELVSAGEVTRQHLTDSKIYIELLAVLRSASKYGSGLNQMQYAAPELGNTSRNGIQTGLAIHLHQQSFQGNGRRPANELALKVMEIFVDWIQREDQKSRKVEHFLAQKSSLETIFNVFISPVKRNPTELLSFLISLHKMLLASDFVVETLSQQDLLVSHLQSQTVLICNQMDHHQFARVASLNEPQMQTKNSVSTKSAIVPSERTHLQGSSSFYEPRNALIGVTPTNIMLSSLTPDQVQVPNTAQNLGGRARQESSIAGTTEQPLSTQQAGQLLQELLEIFWLLLAAKKANEPLSYFDFVIKFDLADTVTMLQRQAQRKQLSALEELATGLLNEMFPQTDQIECDNLSGTFNVRKGIQGFSDMQPVQPVENIDDAPQNFNDSRIDSSDGDQEEMVTPSSQGLSPMFHFNKSASNKLAANVANGFPPMFKQIK